MKILIVEDDAIHQRLAVAVLAAEGHQVTTANSAEEATSAIAADKPELMLLDLSLPGTAGLTFIRQLKQDPQRQHIPVIAVTGYPSKWSMQQALEAGCDAYFVKPINVNELVRKVDEIAQRE